MMPLKQRRKRAISGLLIAAVIFIMIHRWIEHRLGHAAYYSGGTLLACLGLLVLLGARRSISLLPAITVSTLVQIHIYTGLFALVVYCFHVPQIVANGWFEAALSWLFLLVSASGLYGVYASRTIPKRMNAVPGEYRFDRFPWHRQQLAGRADQVLEQLNVSLASPVLGEYYQDALHPFFNRSVPLHFLLVPRGRRRQRLLAELKSLDRYLCEQTRNAAGQFAALIRKRDELDFHYAMQFRLRAWVVFHAMLSMLLVGWTVVHVALVLIFVS